MDAVYIIGGYIGGTATDIVAEFKNDQWRRLANLNRERMGHGSITIEGQTMIIGGNGPHITIDTEVWELENGNNKIIKPALPQWHYAVGVALYAVEKDFCKK